MSADSTIDTFGAVKILLNGDECVMHPQSSGASLAAAAGRAGYEVYRKSPDGKYWNDVRIYDTTPVLLQNGQEFYTVPPSYAGGPYQHG